MTSKPKSKPGRNRITIISAAASVVFIGLLFCLGYWYRYYRPNTIENDSHIYISRSTGFEGFLDSLEKSGAVSDMKSFRKAAIHLGLDEALKPGHYLLKPGLNNKEIERVFSHGWQTPVRIQVKGYIRNFEKMASHLSQRIEADSTEIITAIRDEVTMKSYGFNKASYLSMFIPDTYEVYWTITPHEFLARMKKEYDAFWTPARKEKAQKAGLSQDEVMTLASIVIEETKYEPEMPTIAGVYINRLRKGIPLQADPTVKYAAGEAGITRILSKHLKIESPYNTYLHKGLPPGPITIAPKVAIDAVLNYEKHNYIYFCAKETFVGQHNFAATYPEHLANARRYHAALNAREKAKKNS
ncbi:MAG: endolytic transglycosylase MltG [Bacteroidales bacterium]|nr:endolytic transglycosylase MltG [Bacteroidales bacterium]